MYFLYRFKNIQDEIIYVGRTNNLELRMKHHFLYQKHLERQQYEEVYKIEYAQLHSKTEMDMKKIYYINKWTPKINKSNKRHDEPLDFVNFDDKWIEYHDVNLTELIKLKSVAHNVIKHANEYVKLTNERKNTNYEWFKEHENIRYEQYEWGFNSYYIRLCENSVDDYVKLEEVSSRSFFDDSYKRYTEVRKLHSLFQKILLNGYVEFFEINVDRFKREWDKFEYVIHVYNHESPIKDEKATDC